MLSVYTAAGTFDGDVVAYGIRILHEFCSSLT